MDDELYALKKRVEELEAEVERWASRALIEFHREFDGDWVARLIGVPFPAYGKAATATEAFKALLENDVLEGLR